MQTGNNSESDRQAAPTFDVSVVIPVGDGDGGIGALLTAVNTLKRRTGGRYEIVIVDDGNPDAIETTAARWRAEFEGLVVARHDARKGRGAAARTGALAARGELVAVVDPDSEVPVSNAEMLFDSLQNGADVALASRHLDPQPQADEKPFLERATQTTVMRLSELMVPVGVRDCFSGLSGYRSRALKKIAQRSRVSSAAYTVEWIALAQYLGFQVVESPLLSVRGPLIGNRGRKSATAFSLLKDVWATRKRLANDDYSKALEKSELLSETSFRKLDRQALQQLRSQR